MRADLEAAMGHVITSRVARQDLLSDPVAFAAEYDLDPAETAALAAMREDLAALTPGFLTKRAGMLRGAYPRTFGLLGKEIAGELLEDYLEEQAPMDPAPEDQRALGGWLVEETAKLAAELDAGAVAEDMARFELAGHAAFWAATSTALEGSRLDGFEPDAPLRVHRTAQLGRYRYDLRGVAATPAGRLAARPDDCWLLIVHTGGPHGRHVVRLQADQAGVLEVIRSHPGGFSARSACAEAGVVRASPAALLGRLVSEGVLEAA